jgi:light-harvesting protein B-800-850 alpha chain
MNQGRIWCVVNPSIGLPLFLGSVALMSFTVHFAVLNNSSWFKDFFNGVPLKTSSVETDVAPVAKLPTVGKAKLVIEVAQASPMAFDAGTPLLTLKSKPGVTDPHPDSVLPG